MKNVKTILREIILNKKNGGKEIITEMGLLIIGVVLLILFKGQLTTLVTSAGTSVSEKITALFN